MLKQWSYVPLVALHELFFMISIIYGKFFALLTERKPAELKLFKSGIEWDIDFKSAINLQSNISNYIIRLIHPRVTN